MYSSALTKLGELQVQLSSVLVLTSVIEKVIPKDLKC